MELEISVEGEWRDIILHNHLSCLTILFMFVSIIFSVVCSGGPRFNPVCAVSIFFLFFKFLIGSWFLIFFFFVLNNFVFTVVGILYFRLVRFSTFQTRTIF